MNLVVYLNGLLILYEFSHLLKQQRQATDDRDAALIQVRHCIFLALFD